MAPSTSQQVCLLLSSAVPPLRKNAPLRMSPLTDQRARKVNKCGTGDGERAQPLSWAGKGLESPGQDKCDLEMLVKVREDED